MTVSFVFEDQLCFSIVVVRLFLQRIEFTASAVAVLSVEIAIMNPISDAIDRAPETRRIPETCRIRVFDRELIAEYEALPKRPCEISRRGGSRGAAARHQRANENLHDASPLLGAWPIRSP
jgi:hypothetical protein